MPSWTEAELRAYETRRLSSRPQPERPVQDEPVAETKGEAEHTARIRVSIRSFRTRLLDPDNLCPKYFLDCVRYAGFIKDDSDKYITLEVSQVKVKNKSDERTEIEVIL